MRATVAGMARSPGELLLVGARHARDSSTAAVTVAGMARSLGELLFVGARHARDSRGHGPLLREICRGHGPLPRAWCLHRLTVAAR